MAGRSSHDDPLKVFLFRVEIDDVERAGFAEVSGLNEKTAVSTYREGGDQATKKKSPGMTEYSAITLRRGQLANSTAGGDLDLYEWRQLVHRANVQGQAVNFRKTVDLVQYNRAGAEVRRWRLEEAWPSDYTPMSDLNADSDDDSFETIVLEHEGYELVR